MLKGVLHVHSTYSDGERTLSDLRELFRGEGCSFIAMSDHADAFDDARVREYVAECAALSDERLVFVPGLEFGCERRMHILGYGVTTLNGSTDPQTVIRHIDRQSGISVIAHPQDAAFAWIESFETLPAGIECWNTKYDGQYAPRGRTFRLLHRVRSRRPGMLAFYGQDYHWAKQYRQLYVMADATSNQPAHVLDALKRGAFHAVKGDLELPSSGDLPESLLEEFERTNARSSRFKRFASRVNAVRKQLGVSLPAPIKSQLRRLF